MAHSARKKSARLHQSGDWLWTSLLRCPTCPLPDVYPSGCCLPLLKATALFVKSYQGYQGLVKSDGNFHVAMHLLFYVFCISVYFLSSGTSFDIATDFVCSNFSVVSGFRDGFKNLDPPPVDLWPQVVRPPMRPFHHPTEFPQPFRFTMSYLPRMDGRIPA